jgi:hypothetical protein
MVVKSGNALGRVGPAVVGQSAALVAAWRFDPRATCQSRAGGRTRRLIGRGTRRVHKVLPVRGCS